MVGFWMKRGVAKLMEHWTNAYVCTKPNRNKLGSLCLGGQVQGALRPLRQQQDAHFVAAEHQLPHQHSADGRWGPRRQRNLLW